MHPVADEPRPHPVRGLALGGLALVVRVDEITAAAVNVDGKTEVPVAHRGTLEVPPRTAAAEGARPCGTVGDATPEREVKRRSAARVVEPRIVLRCEDPAHLPCREARELAEAGECRHVVIDPARSLV